MKPIVKITKDEFLNDLLDYTMKYTIENVVKISEELRFVDFPNGICVWSMVKPTYAKYWIESENLIKEYVIEDITKF